MNKAELVDFVATQTGAYKKDVKHIVDAVLEGIEQGMRRDGKVTLVGFGNFVTKNRKARLARNPQTGRPVRVPPKRVPTFKPSEKLKKLIE
jgi:DNA-binding protein HU-beta